MSRRKRRSLFDADLASLTREVPTPSREMGTFNKLLFLSLLSALKENCDCQACKRLRKATEIYEKLVEGL